MVLGAHEQLWVSMGVEGMVRLFPFTSSPGAKARDRVPDLALPRHHPKRIFVHRTLELGIRLSYYDRILKTLPQPFQEPSAGTMPDQAPGPTYEYEDPSTFRHTFPISRFSHLLDFV